MVHSATYLETGYQIIQKYLKKAKNFCNSKQNLADLDLVVRSAEDKVAAVGQPIHHVKDKE